MFVLHLCKLFLVHMFNFVDISPLGFPAVTADIRYKNMFAIFIISGYIGLYYLYPILKDIEGEVK